MSLGELANRTGRWCHHTRAVRHVGNYMAEGIRILEINIAGCRIPARPVSTALLSAAVTVGMPQPVVSTAVMPNNLHSSDNAQTSAMHRWFGKPIILPLGSSLRRFPTRERPYSSNSAFSCPPRPDFPRLSRLLPSDTKNLAVAGTTNGGGRCISSTELQGVVL